MNIPYVIANVESRLADVLNHLLESHPGTEIHIATAYFSIRGAGGRATVTRRQQANAPTAGTLAVGALHERLFPREH